MTTTHYGKSGATPEQIDRMVHVETLKRFYSTKGYKTLCGVRAKRNEIVSTRELASCNYCRKVMEQYNSAISNAAESMTKDLGV